MINSRNNFTEEDYKYVSIIDVKKIISMFEEIIDEYEINYSVVTLYKGHTYLLSLFTLEDRSIGYSMIDYKNIRSKDRKFESKEEFYNALKQLFLDDKFIVLNDIVLKNEDVLYYPVTTNKYLSDNITTRSDEVYKSNLPTRYEFKTTNKVFVLLLVFMLVNVFVGLFCLINYVNYKDILLGIVSLFSSLVSFIVIIKCYAFKTRLVNGLINSSRLLRLNKTYKFENIDYIDNVVYLNLFSTRKTYKIHMKDKSIVKIKYFNSSSSIFDDELNEMIVYLREMFITNKIKINEKEMNNKLIIIISILLYSICIIAL